MEKRSQRKVAMLFGLVYGLVAAIISLIFYFGGADMQSKWPPLISNIILAITIIYAVKNYRDQDLGGYIGYGKSLGTGTLIGLFGGVLVGAYTVFFFTFIDPDMINIIIEKAQEKMIEDGKPEEQIEMGIKIVRFMMKPIVLFFLSIVSTTFWAFIFSLIISAFTKREQTPFDQPI